MNPNHLLRALAFACALPTQVACGSISPHVCTAYDAAREAACDACARMPAECPFPHDAEVR